MSECKHTNITLDCVCPDCGYDSILDPILSRGREQERERIIKLLETHLRYVDWEGIFWEPETTGKSHAVDVADIVALIKGRTEVRVSNSDANTYAPKRLKGEQK